MVLIKSIRVTLYFEIKIRVDVINMRDFIAVFHLCTFNHHFQIYTVP